MKIKELKKKINNLNKEKSFAEENLSTLKRKKMSHKYELESIEKTKGELMILIDEVLAEKDKYLENQKLNVQKVERVSGDKDHLEKLINSDKQNIVSIEEQINDLIVKKSKLEQDIRSNYNLIKVKNDDLSSYNIESQQISGNIHRLDEKLRSNQQRLSIICENKIHHENKYAKYKEQVEKMVENKKSYRSNMDSLNNKRSLISKKLKDANMKIEENNKMISQLNAAKLDEEKSNQKKFHLKWMRNQILLKI